MSLVLKDISIRKSGKFVLDKMNHVFTDNRVHFILGKNGVR